jgi:hypothetical protein
MTESLPHGVLRRPLLVLALFASLAGCGDSCCDDDLVGIPSPPPVCNLRKECGENEAYRNGQCVRAGCETDDECCPGTRCRTELNACWPYQLDPEYACTTDADCADPAQRCLETSIGGRQPLAACVYESCDGDADCGLGRSCFQSVCVVKAPCGGACPAGEACDVATSQCAPVPDEAPGCAQACTGASLLVFSDPRVMSGELCCAVACQCKGLPPIVPTRFGRYSRIALTGNEALVSAYDADYGDLVLARYKLDGTFAGVSYIDGVPAGAAIEADPSGPRGGIAEPGPNVGTHTSLVVDGAGQPRIAYRDEDGKALKVAVSSSNGFIGHFVDGAGGGSDVGKFTDLAIGADGKLYVSYFAHQAAGAPGIAGKATGLKLARSKTATPASAADWDLFWIDARPVFDPCDGQCTAAQACVLDQGAPRCLATTTGCAPGCSGSEECVTGAAGAECRAPPLPPESDEVPRGRGLFSSVFVDGADVWFAYYDGIDQDLRAAKLTNGTATTWVVDGDEQGGHRGGDVGRFPSIGKSGAQLWIAYEDFSSHELRVWQGVEPGVDGTTTTIDQGHIEGEPGRRFVGASAALVTTGASTPVVVYQDASTLDLKLARSGGATWEVEDVLVEGGHGFYADVVARAGQAFIVSVLAELDARGHERSRAAVTVVDLP